MATVRLRVRLGRILEELPAACLFCGRPIQEFTPIPMRLEQQNVKFGLPLCPDHRQDKVIRALKGQFAGPLGRIGGIVDRVGEIAGRIGEMTDLVDLVVNQSLPTKLDALDADDKLRGEKEYTLHDVSAEFVGQLERIRARDAEEFEASLLGAPGATPPMRPEDLSAPFSRLEDEASASSVIRRPLSTRSRTPKWTLYVVLVFFAVAVVLCGLLYRFLNEEVDDPFRRPERK